MALTSHTLQRMPKQWPFQEFDEYLRSLMAEAGIPSPAELSRRSGVKEHQLSNWRRGIAQPSQELLRRLAVALDIPPVKLFVAAGHTNTAELELDDALDLRVAPREILDLYDVYESLDPERLTTVRQLTSVFVAGLRAQMELPKFNPSGRRQAS